MLFDIAKKKEEAAQVPASSLYRSKYLAAHFEKIKVLERDLIRCPEREEFIFLQTEGSFNAFTFIPYVAQHTAIRHLYATTYSISRRTVEALMELHDTGMVEQMTLCISDSMIKRNPVTIDMLTGMVEKRPNIKVIFAWAHAKLSLMETDNAYYCVEGSGNWSDNARYEQYIFANSRGLFEFRKELLTQCDVRYVAESGGLRKY